MGCCGECTRFWGIGRLFRGSGTTRLWPKKSSLACLVCGPAFCHECKETLFHVSWHWSHWFVTCPLVTDVIAVTFVVWMSTHFALSPLGLVIVQVGKSLGPRFSGAWLEVGILFQFLSFCRLLSLSPLSPLHFLPPPPCAFCCAKMLVVVPVMLFACFGVMCLKVSGREGWNMPFRMASNKSVKSNSASFSWFQLIIASWQLWSHCWKHLSTMKRNFAANQGSVAMWSLKCSQLRPTWMTNWQSLDTPMLSSPKNTSVATVKNWSCQPTLSNLEGTQTSCFNDVLICSSHFFSPWSCTNWQSR